MLLIVLSGLGINQLSAQTTLLEQSLQTDTSFNTFTPISVTGAQTWHATASYGAVCSGYTAGQNFENEDWLISPIINLYQTDNVKLTFTHTRGGANQLNTGVTEGWYKAYATANFTGDPATTQWIELEGLNLTIPTAWQFVPSGDLLIPDAAKSEHSRIALRYISIAGQSATWEIKNIKVTGEPQSTNPNAGLFKITNWNTEWLGCTQFGPTDESLQINNVAAAMLAMNSDIYCIQEITNSVAYPSVETIVSLLGNDQWEGKLVPSSTNDCDQRQAIIYKKSKVQFVSATQLSSGNAAQGNSYYYNCSSGRFPALYTINLITGSTFVPISLINIHAKAEDGDAMSYTRRLGASEALKTILDGQSYNDKNLIVIGDFNDYLIGTSSNACACTTSPYQNFTDDEAHYNAITKSITNANTSWGVHPVIENIIISNELSDHYLANSAAQDLAVSQSITDYYNTTSDHLPISATFQFAVLANPEYTHTPSSALVVYPNPVKEVLQFDTAGLDNKASPAIYDLTGRLIRSQKDPTNTLNVTHLPSGVYLLKVGNRYGKFIKE